MGHVAGTALAQPSGATVGVLRSTATSTPAELSDAVDAALLRDLAGIAGIDDPVVSPVDLAEIQLSVGCADEQRACLEAIARAANVGALLVRSLSTTDQGGARLQLRYFDSASSDEPKVVGTEVTAEHNGELAEAVPSLVRELFGIPEIAAPAEPTADAPVVQTTEPKPKPEPPSSERKDSSLLPWILIGAGAAVLTTGLIVGTVANDDFQAWRKRPIGSTDQADRANDELDDLEARALAADIAMVTGAVALGLGASLLALELGGDEPASDEPATLAIEPRATGALLRLRGTFDEAW